MMIRENKRWNSGFHEILVRRDKAHVRSFPACPLYRLENFCQWFLVDKDQGTFLFLGCAVGNIVGWRCFVKQLRAAVGLERADEPCSLTPSPDTQVSFLHSFCHLCFPSGESEREMSTTFFGGNYFGEELTRNKMLKKCKGVKLEPKFSPAGAPPIGLTLLNPNSCCLCR